CHVQLARRRHRGPRRRGRVAERSGRARRAPSGRARVRRYPRPEAQDRGCPPLPEWAEPRGDRRDRRGPDRDREVAPPLRAAEASSAAFGTPGARFRTRGGPRGYRTADAEARPMRLFGPAPLSLDERLPLDAALDDAFAPLRARTANVGAARIRAAVRWAAPPPRQAR